MRRSLLMILIPVAILTYCANSFSQGATVKTIKLNGNFSMDCLTLGNDGVLYGTEGFDGNHIYRIMLDGTTEIFASGLNGPIDIDFDNFGNMFVSTFNDRGVYKLTPEGISSRFATVNIGPSGVVINRDEYKVYVSHYGAGFPGNGNSVDIIDSAGNASVFVQGNGLAAPVSLAIDEIGNIYAPNIADAKLFRITPEGNISLLCQLPTSNIHPFHVGHIEYSHGFLYVTGNSGNPYIFKVSLNGEYEIIAGSGIVGHQDGPALQAQFSGPNGITASVTGDTLYISELTSPSTLRMITGVISNITTLSSEIPSEYEILQNFPNPFNPETKIVYEILHSNIVTITVNDITGKKIDTLVNEFQNPGKYQVSFNGNGYPSGIYYYTINTGDYSKTLKMLLVK